MSDTFSVHVESDKTILSLIPVLDMAVAEELLSTIRQSIGLSNNFTLNCQDVVRVSTSCIQILISAALEVERNGGKFEVINLTDAFERGMNDLGLAKFLKNWSE